MKILHATIAGLGVAVYFFVFHGRCDYKGSERLDGKTVIITGANTGIGKETAIDLARRGGRIICACRSESRGEAAVVDIKLQSGSNNVLFMKLDLASLKSVREFAKKVVTQEERLDILINNAGQTFLPERRTTEDGFEMMMGVNHLGHFLLTNLLLDLIKKSQPSRIINVSSEGHRWPSAMDYDDFMNEKQKYSMLYCYNHSKLAGTLFMLELSKRLKGTSVTANSAHPGVVHTEISRYYEEYLNLPHFANKMLHGLLWLFFKDSRQGAQTTICCAVSERLANVTNKYFAECESVKIGVSSTNETDAKMLWEVSEKLVGLSG